MPIIGFGTFCLKNTIQCEDSVINALQVGYRMRRMEMKSM